MLLRSSLSILATALILAGSMPFASASGQSLESESPQPVITINPPTAYLTTGHNTLVSIYFSKDDQFAIIANQITSLRGIDYLNCKTGEIKTLVETDRLDDCCFPPEQDKFLIAVREEGHLWIEKYNLKGERLYRRGGRKLDREQSVRIFWSPELAQTYVIIDDQIFTMTETEDFKPLLQLDFSISKQRQIKIQGNRLFLPHKNKLRVFDLATRTEIESLEFDQEVRCMEVSADASRVFIESSASGSVYKPSTIFVADWKDNGLEIVSSAELPYRPFELSSVNNDQLILSQPDIKTCCFDINTKKTLWEKAGGGSTVSPSKKLIAFATGNRIDLLGPDGRRISKIAGHNQPITQAKFDSAKNELTTLQKDGQLFVWDTNTGKVKTFQIFDPQSFCSGNLKQDEFICAAKNDLGFFDFNCFDSEGRLKYTASSVFDQRPRSVAPVGEGKLLAINNKKSEVCVWQNGEWKTEYVLIEKELKNHWIANCSLSSDGNWLVAGVSGKFKDKVDKPNKSGYHFVDIPKSEFRRRFYPLLPRAAIFDSSSTHVLLSSVAEDDKNELRDSFALIRLADQKVIQQILLHDSSSFVHSFAMSPDGKQLAYATSSNEKHGFLVTDLESGDITLERFKNINEGFDSITCLQFTDDSSQLITGTQRGKIQVWQVDKLNQ